MSLAPYGLMALPYGQLGPLWPSLWRLQRCCLLAHLNHRPIPTSVFSELYTFKVSITCYPCTSPLS
jgi:hypothetical protein